MLIMNWASWIRIITTRRLIGLLKKSSRGLRGLVNSPPHGILLFWAGQAFGTVGSVGAKVAPCNLLRCCCCCLSGQHPKVQQETLWLLAQSQGLSWAPRKRWTSNFTYAQGSGRNPCADTQKMPTLACWYAGWFVVNHRAWRTGRAGGQVRTERGNESQEVGKGTAISKEP